MGVQYLLKDFTVIYIVGGSVFFSVVSTDILRLEILILRTYQDL